MLTEVKAKVSETDARGGHFCISGSIGIRTPRRSRAGFVPSSPSESRARCQPRDRNAETRRTLLFSDRSGKLGDPVADCDSEIASTTATESTRLEIALFLSSEIRSRLIGTGQLAISHCCV